MQRPSPGLPPSIRDVLRLDSVAASLPEVLAGESKLDTVVRWVHVIESADVAQLLNGGELLLSTGVGWPDGARGLEGYVTHLVQAGVVGLILELGQRYETAPASLLEQCLELDFPLIVLHREARFIAITEAVHGRIIADQLGALQARDEIHSLFTELSLRGSPADFIVCQVGRTLRSPVVLESLDHRVVAFDGQQVGDSVLVDWEKRSRAAHRRQPRVPGAAHSTAEGADDWLITPVEARGTRWGYLIALPGEAHPAGRVTVLEQAAVALALSRLADRDTDEWTRQSHHDLLRSLVGGRYDSEAGLVARFEAAGIAVTGRSLVGIVLRSTSPTIEMPAAAEAVRTAASTIGADALAARQWDNPGTLCVALSLTPDQEFTGQASEMFARSFAEEATIELAELTMAIGDAATDIPGLLSSLSEAAALIPAGVDTPGRGLTMHRVDNRPLLKLITSFGADPRLQVHSEQMLRPLIDYDLEHNGDLLEVLSAYAQHPGNRTRAAATSHLSRSVFYQRIALIESLLASDLSDGETVSALHAALLAYTRRAR